MTSYSALSERSTRQLARRGVQVTPADAAKENPRISADAATAGVRAPDGHQLEAWEVTLARVTSKYPCKHRGDECRPEIDDRLAYVVVTRLYGPELPHSQPCCNPPPFSKLPFHYFSWKIVDASTGKMLYGQLS